MARAKNAELRVTGALLITDHYFVQALEGEEDRVRALFDRIRRDDRHDEVVARRVYALPTGHSWRRVPGVTLVGDAAHLMSPFAGEGANAAMLDGCELALALIEHGDDVDAALAQYEAAMFPRSAEAARQSAVGLDLCFADDAPRGMVEFFGRMGVPDA